MPILTPVGLCTHVDSDMCVGFATCVPFYTRADFDMCVFLGVRANFDTYVLFCACANSDMQTGASTRMPILTRVCFLARMPHTVF